MEHLSMDKEKNRTRKCDCIAMEYIIQWVRSLNIPLGAVDGLKDPTCVIIISDVIFVFSNDFACSNCHLSFTIAGLLFEFSNSSVFKKRGTPYQIKWLGCFFYLTSKKALVSRKPGDQWLKVLFEELDKD